MRLTRHVYARPHVRAPVSAQHFMLAGEPYTARAFPRRSVRRGAPAKDFCWTRPRRVGEASDWARAESSSTLRMALANVGSSSSSCGRGRAPAATSARLAKRSCLFLSSLVP